MGEGSGYGKVILFGEHFVVYGIPAIASALGLNTTAVIEDSAETVVDDKTLNKIFYPGKADPVIQVLDLITDRLNLRGLNYKATLFSTIPFSSGMGSSAALSVALIKAFNDHYNLELTDEEVNSTAYECEKLFHGNPSGIDNSVSTYGGLLWFKRSTPPVFERLKMLEPVEIVVGNTGIVHDTGEVVAGVAERREKNPSEYWDYFKEYEGVVLRAREVITAGDVGELGDLMNRNHALLQKIEVSCPELDGLCEAALDAGAYGAKLTGAGKGGCMLALTPGRELQEKVASALEGRAESVIKTRIGV
jgi:mevalonate kinase